MDSITKEHRSWNMTRIKSKNTSPEKSVREFLTNLGVHYRLHVKTLAGKPDIVIRKNKTAVFVNGCFWHQHEGCKRKTMPKSNTEYWTKKLKRNIEKQNNDIDLLTQNGWKTVIIWECEVKKNDILKTKLQRISKD